MNLPGLLFLSLLSTIILSPAYAGSVFNVALTEDGHYRLNFNYLGGIGEPVPAKSLGLYERGVPIPMQIDHGGDGLFGTGDSIEFVGRRPQGINAWYDEHSVHNIYQLHLDLPSTVDPPPTEPVPGPIVQHLEREIIRVALPHAANAETVEHWYWQRLTHLEDDHFSHTLEWSIPPQTIRIALTGLSRDNNAAAAGLPQHRVTVRLNGQTVGHQDWDGQESVTLELQELDDLDLGETGALLEVVVPPRQLGESTVEIIDAVLLNWIELEYPRDPELVGATITSRAGDRQLLVGKDILSPAWVAPRDKGPDLLSTHNQADYLMISHPSLLQALRPLVDYHREQGLAVKVVSTQAIYEQFNFGVKSPVAIQDFIGHAWQRWRSPAPRFVLLVGDASWAREEVSGNNRNLVPTLHIQTLGALAASDNGFVTVDGDDWRPDLAIGRLPAGSEQELALMVTKLVNYARSPSPGDWQNHSTWIAGVDPQFQHISNALAAGVANRGWTARTIYPDVNAQGGDNDQSRVIDAINEGSALLHFLGHGGRFVWRTGPPDLAGATDLFGLEEIQSLENTGALPLLLSMTCSSGPFDHPSADSMAEAFMRDSSRGAIGVLAASWRVSASRRFSAHLVRALLNSNTRIGEAIMQVKQQEQSQSLVETYNLLGDPALFLAGGRQR